MESTWLLLISQFLSVLVIIIIVTKQVCKMLTGFTIATSLQKQNWTGGNIEGHRLHKHAVQVCIISLQKLSMDTCLVVQMLQCETRYETRKYVVWTIVTR